MEFTEPATSMALGGGRGGCVSPFCPRACLIRVGIGILILWYVEHWQGFPPGVYNDQATIPQNCLII